ncbi:4'-phosphopantetheinyl transferase superfamily protein [Segetibacter sp. 3557_3]|uniref:4'-phosphopantetheinyl transferase family protein n=1 Tax=Segetibacter sp. 3557_3 TaxID=2547429 RepID=UPI001058F751|nr:4'-phosphopantetheinyl transferase superfamily protein [Segetibacter sp. 3557_3]TDH27513.1 4'-phosphopantetheinyl transferase superfamily protein [Segetibacter sp. 3557_3]
MGLYYQQDISNATRLALWEIQEPEHFFMQRVPLQREITHPHKRLQHLAGRYLLPFLFADFPHAEIEIAGTRKPFLPNDQYHFSISHCGNYAAAIASSNERVGVDVELITPRVQNIKRKFLHPEELRFVNAMPAESQLEYLTILWSAKEAIYKWYGLGQVDFSEMIRTFPFQLSGEGWIQSAFLKDELQVSLIVNYKRLDNMCLVWVVST